MRDEEILQQLTEVIQDVLDLPDLELTPETTAEDVDGWDSFNHINIIVAAEQRFGIKFRTSELEGLRNVGELVRLIGRMKG